MGLRDKFLKTSALDARRLEDETIHRYDAGIPTPIWALNIILQGDPHSGVCKGMTQYAGESGTFKTLFALYEAAAFINHHNANGEEALLIFISNEHGAPEQYFTFAGIDEENVVYIRFTEIEEVTTEIYNLIKEVKVEDNVIFIIDSLGLAASKKELTDIESGSDKVDMTRAKKLNAFARSIPPNLLDRNIPLIAINHIYFDQGNPMYQKAIVKGGQGLYLASNEIILTTKKQLKDSSTGPKVGSIFDLTVEKSRFVRRYEKIGVEVSFDGGVRPHSGLLDIAVASKHVVEEGKKYRLPGADKKYWARELSDNAEFWEPVLADDTFSDYIKSHYKL